MLQRHQWVSSVLQLRLVQLGTMGRARRTRRHLWTLRPVLVLVRLPYSFFNHRHRLITILVPRVAVAVVERDLITAQAGCPKVLWLHLLTNKAVTNRLPNMVLRRHGKADMHHLLRHQSQHMEADSKIMRWAISRHRDRRQINTSELTTEPGLCMKDMDHRQRDMVFETSCNDGQVMLGHA